MKPTVPRLVVFAPNWLGDTVMALPAIADVRRAVPDASLVIAARAAIAPLFSMVPGIDERRGAGKRGRESFSGAHAKKTPVPFSMRRFCSRIRFMSALTAWRAGVPERWGYRTDWRRPAADARDRSAGGRASGRVLPAPGQRAGFPERPPFPGQPQIVDLRRVARNGVRELKGAGWDGRRPLVALAPGAAYGGAKRWPAASFAELARALADDGIQTVMVGGRGDLPVARAIEAALGGDVVLNLMATDLPTLAGILAACRALVSNDSGAMHLGAALGVRVTAVFGPTDERLTRPAGDAHVVLTHPVWCRPCMMRECPIDHRCMRGIGVDRVVGAVRQML